MMTLLTLISLIRLCVEFLPHIWFIIFHVLDMLSLTSTNFETKYCFSANLVIETSLFLSQLYGSTTVVMAIYGLHWKWQSLTPCQRHPSEPIEKIFGTIDNVIDLNNLAKFSFGKIFGDWGTYTQHKGLCFFKTFHALRHAYSLNGWTDFDAQYLKRRRLVRGGAFSMIKKIG